MPSIQSSPHPLVFKVDSGSVTGLGAPTGDGISVRAVTRALEGMQKEAIVATGTDQIWRMVCDEGPYLNGSDLAPFPLAFFTAGLAASILGEIRALLDQRNQRYTRLELVQDNRYSMEGSAVKGTMTGGALPVDLALDTDAELSAEQVADLLVDAVGASPACALLRTVLDNRFALSHNGRAIDCARVAPIDGALEARPDTFDDAAPVAPDQFAADIITKLEAAETVFGVEGGAGSSLQAEQKRTLHVRGIAKLREDGLMAIKTQLLKPIGSVFQFVADTEPGHGGGRAPSGLTYLSAGIAFCYMTQLGRYAHIVKRPLNDYRIIQDTAFSAPGASGATGSAASARAVHTQVFVDTGEDDDYARTLVDMGEQTCFLHAACRSSVKMKIHEFVEE